MVGVEGTIRVAHAIYVRHPPCTVSCGHFLPSFNGFSFIIARVEFVAGT